MDVYVFEGSRDPLFAAECMRIRTEVFVVEQGVPVELERDDTDDTCAHFLAGESGAYLATCRAFRVQGSKPAYYKLGRVACLRAARGRGHARRMVERAVRWCVADNAEAATTTIRIDAQLGALPFWTACGFVLDLDSPEFLDAGIVHRRMTMATAVGF